MKSKPVILVVDDQIQNIQLLEAYLIPQGYEIVPASSGEEALEKLSSNQIDLVLLDVMIPDMDGFEITRWIRNSEQRLLPIIMVTALRDTEDRVKGIEAGCDDFISKPFDKMELLSRIRSLLKIKYYNDMMKKYRIKLEITKKSADEAREYAESIINTVREPLIALDQDLRVVNVSRSFYEVFKVNPEETVGQLIYDLGNKQWDIPKLRELLETILPQKASFSNYEVEHNFKTIGNRIMLLNARQIHQSSGKDRIILLAIEDITERRIGEETLAQAAKRESAISRLSSMLLLSVSFEDISELVLECAEEYTCSRYGFIGYIDLKMGYMISPTMTNEIWESSESDNDNTIFKKSDGVWEGVLNNQQSLLNNTPIDDPMFSTNSLSGAPIYNFLSAPAMVGTELVGQVALANSTRSYNQQDLEFVERLATLYAIAIHHQRAEDKIRKMAYHDLLTGLPNRALFYDRYTIAHAGAKRFKTQIGFMMLDLDHFKNINDTLGHNAGDKMLKDFSNILLSIVRETDTVMRLGGDEFVIMLTDVVNPEQIAKVAQKILESARKPFIFNDQEVRTTTSIGISIFPEDGEEVDLLLKHADIALYQIKSTGRDNYIRYMPGMESETLE